ncbi:MAG: 30S ribosomal protein S12 methylthiotransferase RimO [Verrucomicrobia bacterium]|nr:30S ribosomal protein S12 methylthiotransferase RimO [Verrucomicrobiota bacterium]
MSLGCAKNLVDGELMLGALLKDGIEITNDPAGADVVIVNTCSFIDSAQEESVDAILESAALREAKRRGQGLVVAGCLTQRFREELPALLPEVDAFMGVDQIPQVSAIVRAAVARRAARLKGASPARNPPRQRERRPRPAARANRRAAAGAHPGHLTPAGAVAPVVEVRARPTYLPDYATPRFRLTPRHLAYLKIAEGCNHPCSFCIIPRLRGGHRSRPLADVVAEAGELLAAGVKELNLISQDTTYYGLDLRPGPRGPMASPARFAAAVRGLPGEAPTLSGLLRALQALPGRFWIRLLYTHPAHWTDDLIETMAACPKVARYVDLPLQHIHEVMLERMRRETTRAYLEDLIARLRAGVPGLTLRTTFIVGFPGETEAYFESLLDFIRATRFDRLGVFTYSQEAGTVAGKMGGQVPERVRQKRRDRALAEQHAIARARSASWVGRTLTALVEQRARLGTVADADASVGEHGQVREAAPGAQRLAGPYLLARSEADAPDIDGRVYVRGRLPLGEFAQVRVVGHTDYDLIAEPLEAGSAFCQIRS